MPIFCGIHVHLSHRCGCQNQNQAPVIYKVTCKPPRPRREDGPFGLPLELPQELPREPPQELPLERPYPPSRSLLRHKTKRFSRDQRPSDRRRSRSLAERVKELPDIYPGQYPVIVAPVPRQSGQVKFSVEDTSTTANTYTLPTSIFSTNIRKTSPTKADTVSKLCPRYGPDSRPPIRLAKWEVNYNASHSCYNCVHEPPKQRTTKEASTKQCKPSCEGIESTLNKPLPKSPQVQLAQVTVGWHEFSRHLRPEDEPIYFVPVSYSPFSFRSREASLASLNMI